ncbi:hypothetical protein [Arthrobacter burdickii]|uniref:Uncharacterized protein n=1 Tax=Arthrobacter burdickii TaxID=3035920 RepID=A0ABT8K3E6_9MICC|nr:hypothetical protein [Arthrobacter burdickii]MDN4611955.1 hypothetical protein [Arthrobacter burdickii]
MTTGLVVAVVALVLIIAAYGSGGAPTIYTLGAFAIGLVVAFAGFGRRLLAALEAR